MLLLTARLFQLLQDRCYPTFSVKTVICNTSFDELMVLVKETKIRLNQLIYQKIVWH